jgi:hypothetical protein
LENKSKHNGKEVVKMWCISKIGCLFDVESYKFAYVVFLCLILVKPIRKLLLVVLELGKKLTRKTFYNYGKID